MSKAILILEEIPDACVLCPCCDNDSRCWAADGKPTETQLHGINQWCKPGWCPLRPMPEPKEINAFCDAPRSLQNVAWYNAGYNQCLDDIGGNDDK